MYRDVISLILLQEIGGRKNNFRNLFFLKRAILIEEIISGFSSWDLADLSAAEQLTRYFGGNHADTTS